MPSVCASVGGRRQRCCFYLLQLQQPGGRGYHGEGWWEEPGLMHLATTEEGRVCGAAERFGLLLIMCTYHFTLEPGSGYTVRVNTRAPRWRHSSAFVAAPSSCLSLRAQVQKTCGLYLERVKTHKHTEFHIYSRKNHHKSVQHTKSAARTMTRMGKRRRKERIPSAEGDYELEHRMNAISRSTAQLSSAKGIPAVKKEVASTIQPPPWRKTVHRSKEEALSKERRI